MDRKLRIGTWLLIAATLSVVVWMCMPGKVHAASGKRQVIITNCLLRDQTLFLYKVGRSADGQKIKFDSAFTRNGIRDVSSEDRRIRTVPEELLGVIHKSEDSIQPAYAARADEKSECHFYGVTPGINLLTGKDVLKQEAGYSVVPALIEVPEGLENTKDAVKAAAKYELRKQNEGNEPPADAVREVGGKAPATGDTSKESTWAFLMGLSVLAGAFVQYRWR